MKQIPLTQCKFAVVNDLSQVSDGVMDKTARKTDPADACSSHAPKTINKEEEV